MSANTTIEVQGQGASVSVKQTAFRVGWSYDVFLRKNGFAPSDQRQTEWLALSREASKAHVQEIASLAAAGAKCKVRQRAVFNRADARWDTALGVIIVKPGCNDSELITDALLNARRRFAKTIDAMEVAANHQGVIA